MAISEPYYEVKECRVCEYPDLTQVVDFGNQYVSDFTTPNEDSHPVLSPLVLVRCSSCGLVQLKHTVRRELIYKQYWYESGINPQMVKALEDVALKTTEYAGLQDGDYVLDIGSNDGTLLDQYKIKLNTVGVEPSNLAEKPQKHMIIKSMFGANFPFVSGKFKAITSCAMFYSVEKPVEFIKEVKRLLAPDGVFVIQMNDLEMMLRNKTWDNIGHEHIEYYSYYSLKYLLERYGLHIFDIEYNDVNGGSMRAYIRHREAPGTDKPNIQYLSQQEQTKMVNHVYGSIDTMRLKRYALDIAADCVKLSLFIKHEVARGKKVYGYGASSRGNTVLQYMWLDTKVITAIADRNPTKWGKETVGTKIPIISEEVLHAANPDYLLVLPHHFIKSFIEREREFLARGGAFILAIPEPRVLKGEFGDNVSIL